MIESRTGDERGDVGVLPVNQWQKNSPNSDVIFRQFSEDSYGTGDSAISNYLSSGMDRQIGDWAIGGNQANFLKGCRS
jgi:hypothetical protein